MAKRKKKGGFNLGGVEMPAMKFNDPVLQEAYQKWFVDMPLRAPAIVEYYDPTETSTGAVKKSPVYTTMDPYEVERGEMMQKYKYGYESGNAAVFKQAPVVKRPVKQQTAKEQAKALGGAATGNKKSDKETAELIAGRDRTNARIQALGGRPVGQDDGDSMWNTVMDNLMRGTYGMAQGVNRASRAGEKGHGPIRQIEEFGKGFGQGASLKKKTTFTQQLDKRGFDDKVAGAFQWLAGGDDATDWAKKSAKKMGGFVQGVTGFGLDVGADPISYTGLGVVGKTRDVVAAGKKVLKAGEHLAHGSKVASRGRKTPHTYNQIEKELLTGARVAAGKVRHSERALIEKPLRQMRNSIAKTRAKEIRQELRATDEWAGVAERASTIGAERKALRDSLRASDEWASRFDRAVNKTQIAKLNKELNAVVAGFIKADTKKISELGKISREMAEKEADDWLVTALKNYDDVVSSQIRKGIGLRVGKKKMLIPLTPAALSIGSRAIHNIDVVDRGLKAVDKYFHASAGVSPDLHNLRQQATNRGMTRAQEQGRVIREAFRGMHRDVRESVWETALQRGKHSGHTIKVSDKEMDAAEWANTQVDMLHQNIRGITTGNTPMSKRELEAMMPPGFRGKIKTDKNGQVAIRASMMDWELKDPSRALWIAQQAYERANSMRSMYFSAAESMGLRTKGTGALKLPGVYADYKKKGWREVNAKKTNGLLDGVLFDPETAAGLEKLIDLVNNERNWNKFLRGLARVTSPIKFLLTVINPGYHVRNTIGDFFINTLDDVSFTSYRQSAQVLMRSAQKYGGPNPLIMMEGDLVEHAFRRPSQNVLFHTKKSLKKPGGTYGTAVTEAEIYGGMHQYGITQNFSLTEFSNIIDNPNVANRIGSGAKAKLVHASEMRENYMRLAHFIDLVKKNPSNALSLDENMAWAAARIRKTHFDYTDFTRFEKQVASNLIPFYKWTRKAVPLILEIMMTQPGKAIVPTKAQISLSMMAGHEDPLNDPLPNLDGMLPEWMIEAGYMPGNPSSALNILPGFDSQGPGMFALPNPFTDVWTQTLDPAVEGARKGPGGIVNFLMQQGNPALKVPYELMENKNTFLSREGNRVPIWREDTKKEDIQNYLINQVPYARQVNRAFGGDADKRNFGAFGSQLLGIYGQQLTPSILRGELYRQEQVASDRYADLKDKITEELKAKGVKPPKTPAEWDALLEALDPNYQRPTRKKKFETVIP